MLAIRDGAGALPLLIPPTDAPLDASAVLDAAGGLLFTGSPSNVAPSYYGAAARPGTELDERRDATALSLLRAAIAAGKPPLATCRGFQELNAALGGSLHQLVHEISGRLDHREAKGVPLARLSGLRIEAPRRTARSRRFPCRGPRPSCWEAMASGMAIFL